MQSADDEENRVTNTSSTQNACNSLPRSCSVSSNALASGPNDAHVLTAREFAQSVECWLWQQQCWAQQLSWMSWMHYNMPLFAAASAVAVPASTSPTSNDVRQNLAGSLFQPAANQQLQAGRDCRLASVGRRLGAEFIDFMLVFSVKLLVSMIALDYGYNLFQFTSETELEQLLFKPWDHNIALAVTTEIFVMEIVNRIFICIFETICLWKMGATPGKRMMGICVVSCEDLLPLPDNRLRVLPGGNISFVNALLRATVKNFSMAFFFPVCLTVFFFQHNRTMYDIVSGSIVIEQYDDIILQLRRRR